VRLLLTTPFFGLFGRSGNGVLTQPRIPRARRAALGMSHARRAASGAGGGGWPTPRRARPAATNDVRRACVEAVGGSPRRPGAEPIRPVHPRPSPRPRLVRQVAQPHGDRGQDRPRPRECVPGRRIESELESGSEGSDVAGDERGLGFAPERGSPSGSGRRHRRRCGVSTTHSFEKRAPSMTIHHVETMPPCDVADVAGIPTTNASRTLLRPGRRLVGARTGGRAGARIA
jgi:hypothetical protein